MSVGEINTYAHEKLTSFLTGNTGRATAIEAEILRLVRSIPYLGGPNKRTRAVWERVATLEAELKHLPAALEYARELLGETKGAKKHVKD
jgi:hypothetical protein